MSGADLEEKKTEPKWAVDWGSLRSKTNLKAFQVLLEENQDKITALEKIQGREVILLFGLTGAGKSTVTNYLLGCELEEGLSEAGDAILVPKAGQRVFVPMGEGIESKTLVPEAFPFGEGFLVDCPGFEENRGSEYSLCTRVLSHLVLRLASRVRVVVVLSHHSIADKAADFQQLVQTLLSLFKDLKTVTPSLLFLLNKTPQGFSLRHFSEKLSQLQAKCLREFKSEEERSCLLASSEAKEIADKQLKALKANLDFLDMLRKEPERVQILNLLDSRRIEGLSRRFWGLSPIASEQFCFDRGCDFSGFRSFMGLLADNGITLLERQHALSSAFKYSHPEMHKDWHALKRLLRERTAHLEEVKSACGRRPLLEVALKSKQLSLMELKQSLDVHEAKIRRNQDQKNALHEEMSDCGREDLVEYWEREADFDPDKWLMFLFATVGITVAILAAPELPMLMAAGTASAGFMGWVISKIKEWAKSETFYYEGIPFSPPARLNTWTNGHGWLVVEENKPEEGRYKAIFYGNPFYRSMASVTISVPIRNIPANASRLQEIPGELKALAAEELKLREEWVSLEQSYDGIRRELEHLKADLQSLPASAEPGAAEPGEMEVIVKELEYAIQETQDRIKILEAQAGESLAELKAAETAIRDKREWVHFMVLSLRLFPGSDPVSAKLKRFIGLYQRQILEDETLAFIPREVESKESPAQPVAFAKLVRPSTRRTVQSSAERPLGPSAEAGSLPSFASPLSFSYPSARDEKLAGKMPEIVDREAMGRIERIRDRIIQSVGLLNQVSRANFLQKLAHLEKLARRSKLTSSQRKELDDITTDFETAIALTRSLASS